MATLSHLGVWCYLCGCCEAGTRGVAVPWHEASQLRMCTVNLQHHSWQVPELMSHKGKQSNGGCPYPRMPGQGQGWCMLPPWALNGCGQGRDAAAACCDCGRTRAWHRGRKGQPELHWEKGSMRDNTGEGNGEATAHSWWRSSLNWKTQLRKGRGEMSYASGRC